MGLQRHFVLIYVAIYDSLLVVLEGILLEASWMTLSIKDMARTRMYAYMVEDMPL